MHLLIITNKLIPKRFAAYTMGFVILLRPEYKTDLGLIEHEKVHVRQFWNSLGTFGILYKLSKRMRLKYELEAYKKQLEYAANREYTLDRLATHLSTLYNLNITKEQAISLLK